MKNILKNCLYLLFIAIAFGAGMARADDESDGNRNAAKRFATLPDGVRLPEGITANPDTREIYVSTFESSPTTLLRFAPNSKLGAQRDFGARPLLGLEFDRASRNVYFANVGDFAGSASGIQRIAVSRYTVSRIKVPRNQ